MPATGFIRGPCEKCKRPSRDLRARNGKIVCPECDKTPRAGAKPTTGLAILDYVRRAIEMPTVAELRDEFCIAEQTVQAHLDRLTLAGKLRKSDGRYELANGEA